MVWIVGILLVIAAANSNLGGPTGVMCAFAGIYLYIQINDYIKAVNKRDE